MSALSLSPGLEALCPHPLSLPPPTRKPCAHTLLKPLSLRAHTLSPPSHLLSFLSGPGPVSTVEFLLLQEHDGLRRENSKNLLLTPSSSHLRVFDTVSPKNTP